VPAHGLRQLKQRQVGRLVHADDRGVDGCLVHTHRDLRGLVDHVSGRGDLVFVDEEA
jgi:hypothetical protein